MRIAIAGATGLVGRPLVTAVRDAGHVVVALSRSEGVDLTDGSGLDLEGVDAVVDVTNSPSQEQDPATQYFTAIAEHLGAAAIDAGVRRTVVLSIIGVDLVAGGYLTAKLAHEQASQERAPDVRVLRAAQFHEFAGQMLGWRREGDRASIPDQPTQPVDLDEVVRQLLAMATDDDPRPLVEIAGPRREQLPDLVSRLDPSVTVVPEPVREAERNGALLPGPDALIVGVDFDTWLATTTRR